MVDELICSLFESFKADQVPKAVILFGDFLTDPLGSPSISMLVLEECSVCEASEHKKLYTLIQDDPTFRLINKRLHLLIERPNTYNILKELPGYFEHEASQSGILILNTL